jgi:hypothetical protein
VRQRLTVLVPGKTLSHTSRDRHNAGTDHVRGALPLLRRRLPANWHVEIERTISSPRPQLAIRAPDGRKAFLTIVSRTLFEPKDVAVTVATLAQAANGSGLFVSAPYLSRRACELLTAAGASYADSTGNLRLALDRPAVFIEQQGALKDPFRTRRPLQSLSGPVAARVLQILSTVTAPFGIRELARRERLPRASFARVIDFLTREGVVTRGPGGRVEAVDLNALGEVSEIDARPAESGPSGVEKSEGAGRCARANAIQPSG